MTTPTEKPAVVRLSEWLDAHGSALDDDAFGDLQDIFDLAVGEERELCRREQGQDKPRSPSAFEFVRRQLGITRNMAQAYLRLGRALAPQEQADELLTVGVKVLRDLEALEMALHNFDSQPDEVGNVR